MIISSVGPLLLLSGRTVTVRPSDSLPILIPFPFIDGIASNEVVKILVRIFDRARSVSVKVLVAWLMGRIRIHLPDLFLLFLLLRAVGRIVVLQSVVRSSAFEIC